jgi:transcriptional regulator with XRE-family HTH domain
MSLPMDILFSDWLVDRMKEMGWSQADFARASGLTRQAISYYLSDKSKSPDEFALQKIARALTLPPEYVFRKAGLLPAKPEDDLMIEVITHLYQQLPTEDDKKDAVEYMRLRLRIAEERGKHDPIEKKRARKT